jgi:hypothetical protein
VIDILLKYIVYNLVKEFEEVGSLLDQQKSHASCPSMCRVDEAKEKLVRSL